MKAFEVPAVIADRDISRLGLLKTLRNSEEVTINGRAWAPQTLEFHGFVGKIDFTDGLTHGVYKFCEAEEPPDGIGSFSFEEELFATAPTEDFDGEG